MPNKRKCVGCGEIKPRNEMIKITRDFKTDTVVLNPDSLTFGRSAYLCYNQNCINNALKKNKLGRVLKLKHSVDWKGLINEQFKG